MALKIPKEIKDYVDQRDAALKDELLREIQKNVHNAVRDLTKYIDQRDNFILKEHNKLRGRVDKLEIRVDKLEVRIDKLEVRVDKLEVRADKLEARTDALEGRTATLEGRAKTLEGRVDTLEGRVDALRIPEILSGTHSGLGRGPIAALPGARTAVVCVAASSGDACTGVVNTGEMVVLNPSPLTGKQQVIRLLPDGQLVRSQGDGPVAYVVVK